MKEFTLEGFIKHLGELAVAMPAAEHVALEHAAVVIEKEAKRVIGTYDYDWPPLAESTKEQRERAGFPADEPLLRTGEMRESIEHTVQGHEAYVGSNNDKAVYQELGTSKIPPRSFLGDAAAHKGHEVAEAVGRTIHHHLIGNSVNSPGD
jgi:hypothetical protein